jgi:hypothetical protein
MSIEDRTVVGVKAQLSKFSGIISKSFKKPKKRLVKEMLYGIQASKDVKLSNKPVGAEDPGSEQVLPDEGFLAALRVDAEDS